MDPGGPDWIEVGVSHGHCVCREGVLSHQLNADARASAQSSQKVGDTRRNAGVTVSQVHNQVVG